MPRWPPLLWWWRTEAESVLKDLDRLFIRWLFDFSESDMTFDFVVSGSYRLRFSF